MYSYIESTGISYRDELRRKLVKILKEETGMPNKANLSGVLDE